MRLKSAPGAYHISPLVNINHNITVDMNTGVPNQHVCRRRADAWMDNRKRKGTHDEIYSDEVDSWW